MRSISTTNNARRRTMRRRSRRAVAVRLVLLSLRVDDDDCGQCLGTGTIEGGLGGDGTDEECPAYDGIGVLPEER